MTHNIYAVSLLLLLEFCLIGFAQAEERAKKLFAAKSPALFQIQLINNEGKEKSSIGSGFQVSPDGLVATNYHVVSGLALHPDKYHLEYVDAQKKHRNLALLRVDVINDLALLKLENTPTKVFFTIASDTPKQGDEIYSLGNPYDMGMIVVPGTYNGLEEGTFTERVHFTGAVNSGMSGGPVVNNEGEVVGINVASGGNQIGLLVPHKKLRALIAKQPSQHTINAQITQQLHDKQRKMFKKMMDAPWQSKKLGQAIVPQIKVPFITCWGESNEDEPDQSYKVAGFSCKTKGRTFIGRRFQTHRVSMHFTWLEDHDLGAVRFYKVVDRRSFNALDSSNRAGEYDVGMFKCQHNFVRKGKEKSMLSRSVLCVRAYIHYPSLYDVVIVTTTLDRDHQALISSIRFSGVEQKTAYNFAQRIMEMTQWQ